jgi:hypothetical protein
MKQTKKFTEFNWRWGTFNRRLRWIGRY